jgi:hypothetical protein
MDNKTKLARPEIRDRILFAAQMLSSERSDCMHVISLTQFVNGLIFEEWNRKHPGMMFPDINGIVMPIECTPSQVNT